jgi:heptosyltransferase III
LPVTEGGMLNRFYRTVRHGLKVRLNYYQNIRNLRGLRTRVKRENPGQKILAVMLLEHLGDIVACEPIVRYLKKMHPDAYIIWGVKNAYRELIENNPHIGGTLVVHCLTERLLLANSGLFDEVFDLHFSDRYCSLCRRPLRKPEGDSNINLTNYFHKGSLLSAMSQSTGLPALDDQPMVYIPESAARKVDSLNLPKEFVVINCTSNAPEKGWPREKWELLLGRIKETLGLPVFEVGTATFIDGPVNLSKSLCGKLSILESAEVIRRAKLFVGIDSGPAHLANAVGTPGVIIIGSHLGFKRYLPFSGAYGKGERSAIVYREGSVADVPPEQVFSEVRRMLR